MNSNKKFKTIDEYHSTFQGNAKVMLEEMRSIIKKAAPKAEEIISYNMPAFKFHGVLVYYAAYKNHIGFYPTSSGVRVFKDELTDYKTSKGAIQFPIEKKLPVKLIIKIVKYRLAENIEKANAKLQKKK